MEIHLWFRNQQQVRTLVLALRGTQFQFARSRNRTPPHRRRRIARYDNRLDDNLKPGLAVAKSKSLASKLQLGNEHP